MYKWLGSRGLKTVVFGSIVWVIGSFSNEVYLIIRLLRIFSSAPFKAFLS